MGGRLIHYCGACGYELFGDMECPKCSPGKEDTPMLTCLRCGYSWVPRKEKPVSCPECKTRKWDTEKPKKYQEAEEGEVK
jgi:rubrerythrin